MRPQKSVNDIHAINDHWRLWCRLCAKEDAQNNINIFFKEEHLVGGGANSNDLSLVDAVRKYFWVNISSIDELPQMLCTECFSRVTSMVNFSERVSKVQQMFWTLQNSNENTKLHLQSLRLKYGLLDEAHEHVIHHQLPEVHYIEENPIADEFEETTFKEEASAKNPLEPTRISIKTKKKILDKEKINKAEDIYNVGDKDFGDETESERDDLNGESFAQTKLERNSRKRKQRSGVSVLQQDGKSTTTSRKRQCQVKPKLKPIRHIDTSLDMGSENARDANDDDVVKLDASNMINFEDEAETESDNIDDKDFVPPNYIEEKLKEADITDSQQEVKVKKREQKIKSVVQCDICKRIFPYQSALRRHQEVHAPNKHTCPVCGLQLNTRNTFRDHMVVHSDVMKYKCDYCGRGFKRIKTMQNHLILHTGLRPFLCEFCGRTFPTSVNCRTHKTLAHRKELAAIEAIKASGRKTLQSVGNQYTKVENSQST